jgi:hypothetical protein
MVNEFAKDMGKIQGDPNEDNATESDHVEALLKGIEPTGEEEGS